MANKVYSNFVLSNLIEDQFNSHLNLQNFVTVKDDLVGTPGMIIKINRYKATDGTEEVKIGKGNTKAIEVDFVTHQYEIKTVQNKFLWFDEHAMTDDMLVITGTKHMSTDMFNFTNKDIYTEYMKGKLVTASTSFNFGAFVDAQSMLNVENLEDISLFAFIHPKDVAALRRSLKDDLKYVESFAKSGYVGTVAGVNVYTKKDAEEGEIIMATKEAVTMFLKKGTEVEQKRDPDKRENSLFSRKYYTVALTDETKTVRIHQGTATETTDTSPVSEKKYYKQVGLGYIEAKPETNPKTEHLFELK